MYGKPRPVPSPDRWRDRRARTGIHHQIDWYWQSFRMEVCGWRLCEWSGIIGRQAALTRWPLHLPVSDFRRTASPVRLRRFCRPETEWIQENSRRIHLHCWPFCGVPSVWSATRKYAKNWGLRVVKVHDIRLLARNVNSERLLECLPILLEGVPPHSCQP
jgi:hypothetical protein